MTYLRNKLQNLTWKHKQNQLLEEIGPDECCSNSYHEENCLADKSLGSPKSSPMDPANSNPPPKKIKSLVRLKKSSRKNSNSMEVRNGQTTESSTTAVDTAVSLEGTKRYRKLRDSQEEKKRNKTKRTAPKTSFKQKWIIFSNSLRPKSLKLPPKSTGKMDDNTLEDEAVECDSDLAFDNAGLDDFRSSRSIQEK